MCAIAATKSRNKFFEALERACVVRWPRLKGRSPARGVCGQLHPGFKIPASPPFASVAQLDRVLGYEPTVRRFRSSRMHHLLSELEKSAVAGGPQCEHNRVTLHRLKPSYSVWHVLVVTLTRSKQVSRCIVAQLDEIARLRTSGRRFESSRMHHSLIRMANREVISEYRQ